MSEQKYMAKYCFGMAPISGTMRRRYDNAMRHLWDIVEGNISINEIIPEYLSEAKGMFNRCLRKDQWDWFSVFTELGSPKREVLIQFANRLELLRRNVLVKDKGVCRICISEFIQMNIYKLIGSYYGCLSSQYLKDGQGWIYILSTREQPDILKIGRTNRSIVERVQEINSATGVLAPWGARCVFRVRNTSKAEAGIHRYLSAYRIRKDREFFKIQFREATDLIREYLQLGGFEWT